MKDVRYIRLDLDRGVEERDGKVVIDAVVEIVVEGVKSFKMHMVPRDLMDAAVGRLFFMGLIEGASDIKSFKESGNRLEIEINEKRTKLKPVGSDLEVDAGVLLECMKKLFESTDVWELTGGVHSAGLFDELGRLLYSMDDIGKGNAIDKVIGRGLREGVDFSRTILASTGRQIGFMVEKPVRAGIPIVVARGAPLSSSIEIAREYGVSLVCFAKGRRMNIYTCPERIRMLGRG